MNTIQTIDPYTQKPLKRIIFDGTKELMRKIQKAEDCYQKWKEINIKERIVYFSNLEHYLIKNTDVLAMQITLEMGKPIEQSRAEIEKCIRLIQYYIKHADEILRIKKIKAEFPTHVQYDPIGIVLQIMPWNFPFWQVFRFSVPTLLAGNVTLLKHAPNVFGCAEMIEKAFESAGFSKACFQAIYADVDSTTSLIQDKRIKGVALTGSVRAGKAVGALAGAEIKRQVLELGGADPFIVFKDADIDQAAKVAVQSRMTNSGQTCISAKRIIVQEQVYDKFLKALKFNIKQLKIGDPKLNDTDISVLAREDIALQLQRQVDRSIEKGARVLMEGGHVAGTNLFKPMILGNIQQDMPAYSEELFGPVVCLFSFKDIQQAIEIANDTDFGLGATVYTSDMTLAREITQKLDVGSVAINKMMSSDPRIPFGGTKMSGIGRELGDLGMLSFVNIKSVTIDHGNKD